jgi:hypothetical protein
MRRDAGLSVEDRIRLSYRASPGLRGVLEAHGARIREDIGATELVDLDEPSAGSGPSTSLGRAAAHGEPVEPLTTHASQWEGTLEGETIALALQRLP